jgi:hypothetical protein
MLVLTVGAPRVIPVRAEAPAGIDALAWLTGCWASDAGEPGSGEHWTAPAGGTMLGVSRTVRQGKTVEYEFVVIRALDDGRLAYIAHPSGQPAAAFPLQRMAGREVVFENLEHDFPQRVAYRLHDDERLVAWIEGTRDGETRKVEFPMRRSRCVAD